ncbi:MAG TPA: type VI secretion system baseplate subunit TssE [Steroidobacteraceae bacterium]|nr:type VI secretion system baseplate subunit TssE [Steroidobacteraceae bacterium]
MADISLRERLQPALLDRLTDEERQVFVTEVSAIHERLGAANVTAAMITSCLHAHGFRAIEDSTAASHPTDGSLRLKFTSVAGNMPAEKIRALQLGSRPGGAWVTLGDVADVQVHARPNPTVEPAERRLISMRRLRELVQRDLGWLLNTSSLESTEDLDDYPEIRRSVLNFGLPSLAGRAASSIDASRAAQSLAEALRAFEPRLTRVTVTPDLSGDRMDARTLSFNISGELWGRPAPQYLQLRTSLDVESGDVSVVDSAG